MAKLKYENKIFYKVYVKKKFFCRNEKISDFKVCIAVRDFQ